MHFEEDDFDIKLENISNYIKILNMFKMCHQLRIGHISQNTHSTCGIIKKVIPCNLGVCQMH